MYVTMRVSSLIRLTLLVAAGTSIFFFALTGNDSSDSRETADSTIATRAVIALHDRTDCAARFASPARIAGTEGYPNPVTRRISARTPTHREKPRSVEIRGEGNLVATHWNRIEPVTPTATTPVGQCWSEQLPGGEMTAVSDVHAERAQARAAAPDSDQPTHPQYPNETVLRGPDISRTVVNLGAQNEKTELIRGRRKLYQSVGSRIGDHARAHRQSQDRWEILGRREPVATRRNGIEPVAPTVPDQ